MLHVVWQAADKKYCSSLNIHDKKLNLYYLWKRKEWGLVFHPSISFVKEKWRPPACLYYTFCCEVKVVKLARVAKCYYPACVYVYICMYVHLCFVCSFVILWFLYTYLHRSWCHLKEKQINMSPFHLFFSIRLAHLGFSYCSVFTWKLCWFFT